MTEAASTAPPITEKATSLPAPLLPPDLVIQDELHLISGPLGTMAGLYEAAIEALCVRGTGGNTIRPKIVASTATVRQAQEQIQALFARSLTRVFPAPGPEPARLLLRPHGLHDEDTRPAIRGDRGPGPESQGGHAQSVAGADGDSPEGLRGSGRSAQREEPGRSIHDRAGLFQQPEGVGRRPAHSRRGNPEHHQGVRNPQANRRNDRSVPGPEELLRGGGAYVSRLHGQGGLRPVAGWGTATTRRIESTAQSPPT